MILGWVNSFPALWVNYIPAVTPLLFYRVQGRNNPFIVEQLNISANTLKTHLRNLYRKCGVANRQELLSLLEEYRKLAIIP